MGIHVFVHSIAIRKMMFIDFPHENQSVIICVTIVMAPWHILLGRNFRHFFPGILKLLEPQSVLLVQLLRILLRQLMAAENMSKQPLSRIYMDEYQLCVDRDEKIGNIMDKSWLIITILSLNREEQISDNHCKHV